jgi:hypothetical protein
MSLQAGYDVNALEQGSYYTSFHTPAAPAPVAPVTDPFADQQQSYEPQPSPEPPKKKWYKTNKGRALIVLGVILLVGLIAGIAAGTAAARQSRNTTLLSNGTNSQDQGQNQTSSTQPFAEATTSPNNVNPTPVSPGQEPTTLIFGNGNGATPTSHSNHATTIVFGGQSSQPAAIAPTPGTGSSGGGNDNNNGGDIPLICYEFPHIQQCSPYFQNGP